MADFLVRVVFAVAVIGLGVLGSWFLHTRSLHFLIESFFDIMLWSMIGSSMAGLFGGAARTDPQIIQQLRSRARNR